MEKCTDPTWCSYQLTEQEAKDLYFSFIWRSWTDEQIFRLQFFQKKILLDMDRFRSAINKVFNRKVQSWEMGDRETLLKFYLKHEAAPSINEFIDLIIEKVVQKKGIEKPELKKPDLPEDFILRNWLNLYK